MHQYKELKIWQKAIEIVSIIYRTTIGFPESERFGLIAQINRAAVSIPSNIAEGQEEIRIKNSVLPFYCTCINLRGRDTINYFK